MVSKDENKYVIWPSYFDRTLSRSAGRKLPKKQAVDKPAIDNIAKAAKSLGLNPVVEKEAFHPSQPWKNEGRIMIDKKEPKTKLLKQIAKRL